PPVLNQPVLGLPTGQARGSAQTPARVGPAASPDPSRIGRMMTPLAGPTPPVPSQSPGPRGTPTPGPSPTPTPTPTPTPRRRPPPPVRLAWPSRAARSPGAWVPAFRPPRQPRAVHAMLAGSRRLVHRVGAGRAPI